MRAIDFKLIVFALALVCLVAIAGPWSAWAHDHHPPEQGIQVEISPYVLASGYTQKQLYQYLVRRIIAREAERGKLDW